VAAPFYTFPTPVLTGSGSKGLPAVSQAKATPKLRER